MLLPSVLYPLIVSYFVLSMFFTVADRLRLFVSLVPYVRSMVVYGFRVTSLGVYVIGS